MKTEEILTLLEADLQADLDAGRLDAYRAKVKMLFDRVHSWIGRLTSREALRNSLGTSPPAK